MDKNCEKKNLFSYSILYCTFKGQILKAQECENEGEQQRTDTHIADLLGHLRHENGRAEEADKVSHIGVSKANVNSLPCVKNKGR